MKKLISVALSLITIILHTPLSHAETKKAAAVFAKWKRMQRLYHGVDITKALQRPHLHFLDSFKATFKSAEKKVHEFRGFIDDFAGEPVDSETIDDLSLTRAFEKNMKKLWHNVEHDMPKFVDYLREHPLKKWKKFDATKHYYRRENLWANLDVSNMMFAHDDTWKHGELLRSVAERFYQYCFSPKTATQFQKMMMDPDEFNNAKFLYSVIWRHLAGIGWRTWTQESLDNIKRATDKGKRITYIAGGSDIYYLIKNGIFNVTIIDPQLPSQVKYYTEDWSWLALGKDTTDVIEFADEGIDVVLKRTSFHESKKTFDVRLASGRMETFHNGSCVWKAYTKSGKYLGHYTFDRRFATQADFSPADNEELMISFNELYFIAAPGILKGWGITPARFPSNFKMHVKQLVKPVTKEEVCNLRIASTLNKTDLKYIYLGTCIN